MTKRIPGGLTKLEKTKKENRELELALASAYRIITVLVDRSMQPVIIHDYETRDVEGYRLNRSNGKGYFQFTVTRTPPPVDPSAPPTDTGPESATEAPTEEQSAEPDPVQ